MFTSCIKPENRKVHCIVVQQRQRNVKKNRNARTKLLFWLSKLVVFCPSLFRRRLRCVSTGTPSSRVTIVVLSLCFGFVWGFKRSLFRGQNSNKDTSQFLTLSPCLHSWLFLSIFGRFRAIPASFSSAKAESPYKLLQYFCYAHSCAWGTCGVSCLMLH